MPFVYYRLYIASTLTLQLPIRSGPEQRAQGHAQAGTPFNGGDAYPRKGICCNVEGKHAGGGWRYFPDFKALIDATEQEIPRRGRKAKRESHYSGKEAHRKDPR